MTMYSSFAHLHSSHTHTLKTNFDKNKIRRNYGYNFLQDKETGRIITAKPESLKIVSIQSIS